LFGKILYRGLLWTLLACFLSGGVVATAQEERPHFTPGERKVSRKKDAGPRALAVLQMSAGGKVSLVPVAILINGKFWDASAYKANPVPMALEAGTVYEGERAGSSVGLFTVNTALHSNAVNAQVPWIGTGAWLPEGKDAPNKPMKAETTPVGINTGDEPPRLTKGGSSSNDKPSNDKPAANNAPASSSNPSSSENPPSSSSSGDEPPRLKRPASSSGSEDSGSNQTGSTQAGSTQKGSGQTNSGQTNSGQSAPQSTPSSSSAPTDGNSPDSKPSLKRPDQDKSSQNGADKPAAPKPPESDSGASEENRPRLRRGKPATSFADEDVPGYSKPGANAPASAKKSTAASMSAPEIIDLVPAISDAKSDDLHAFNFIWLKDEEDERRKQIEGIAKQEVVTYLSAQAKAMTTPTAASTKTGANAGGRTPAKKIAEPILDNVHMVAYDLWGNNTPVIVFSADAHLPPPSAGTPQSEVATEMKYSVTLVLRPDIYDTLRQLYVGVTDKFHLDITPRLQLIDAVDADGDGRGELLFKEVSDAGAGWILYRASADKLWKMFDSLSPE
jgi:hypothetical protein